MLSFEAVRTLREIHDGVLFASSLCRGNVAVIRTVKCLRENDVRYKAFIESSFEKLRGYITSFETLQKRINNTIKLVCLVGAAREP